MKRLMLLLLGVICVLSFASCGSSEIETYSKTISTMNTFITINFYDETTNGAVVTIDELTVK